MRTKSAMRNIITSIIGQFFGIIISFVTRTVFIRMLNAEYLGVNGLFTNILSMLSLAEMGFGSAIIYALYKPLVNKDETKINALMNFYSTAYRVIGIIVFSIGLSLLPFMDYIIKDRPQISHLNLIYLLYLTSTASTYFFAYKRTLIIADQKEYISTIYRYSFIAITNVSQIIILLLTRNFILFLLVQVILKFLENILLSRQAEKMYPFLSNSKGIRLDKDSRNSIFKNVRAMVYHRLGGVVVNGTDNILISSLVGISWVGLYSNYYMIITAINTIVSQMFASVTASVGNLNAVESKEKSYSIYKSIFFVNFWLFGFCSISLLILFNPLITLWLGKEYLMSGSIVTLVVINFYIKGMRKTTLMFRDSLGLFWHDRYKPVFESIINLVVSIVLAKQYGIVGVFIGTFISSMTTCFWIEPYILYKYGFERKVRDYFFRYITYSLVLMIATAATWFTASLFTSVTIGNFIGRLILCLIIPNSIFLIFFYKKNEFKYILVLSRALINKKA